MYIASNKSCCIKKDSCSTLDILKTVVKIHVLKHHDKRCFMFYLRYLNRRSNLSNFSLFWFLINSSCLSCLASSFSCTFSIKSIILSTPEWFDLFFLLFYSELFFLLLSLIYLAVHYHHLCPDFNPEIPLVFFYHCYWYLHRMNFQYYFYQRYSNP